MYLFATKTTNAMNFYSQICKWATICLFLFQFSVIFNCGTYSVSAQPTLDWLKSYDVKKLQGPKRITHYTCVHNYKQCRKKDEICNQMTNICELYVLPKNLNKTQCCEVPRKQLSVKEQYDCDNWHNKNGASVLEACTQNKDERKIEPPTLATTTLQPSAKTTPGPTDTCTCTALLASTIVLGILISIVVVFICLICCTQCAFKRFVDILKPHACREYEEVAQAQALVAKAQKQVTQAQETVAQALVAQAKEQVTQEQVEQAQVEVAQAQVEVAQAKDKLAQLAQGAQAQAKKQMDEAQERVVQAQAQVAQVAQALGVQAQVTGTGSGQATAPIHPASGTSKNGGASPKTQSPRSTDHDSLRRRMPNRSDVREKEQRDGRDKQKRSPEATSDDSNAETGEIKEATPLMKDYQTPHKGKKEGDQRQSWGKLDADIVNAENPSSK